jgi:hypothetical protein
MLELKHLATEVGLFLSAWEMGRKFLNMMTDFNVLEMGSTDK